METSIIGERLYRARVSRGLSLEELAHRVGDISKQALSKLETGKMAPNSARLLTLSKALGIKPEYFFRHASLRLAPLEFRKLAKMPLYRQVQVREQMHDHLERYIALEDSFVDSVAIPVIRPGAIEVHSVEEAEHAAERLRSEWNTGADAIANLVELLEAHGIKVVLLDVCEDFDGACGASENNAHVLISLNASRPGERMRFTAAHELGHWIMKLPDDMPEKEKEHCCHRFAGAFLFPAAQVRAEFGEHQRSRVHPQELYNAKKLYGVSMQGIVRRLKDLGLLSEAGYKQISFLISTKGWRKEEPGKLRAERPTRFESLVFRAYAEELISKSRAAEFLQLPLSKMDADLAGGLVSE
jgi:Zn-dependent peptidase ImmA (M78 family)/DNA-binding XRE family transcriptional regulator